MTTTNEKVAIEIPEVDFTGIKVPPPVSILKELAPTPAETLGYVAGNLAGATGGYLLGKALGAGFWGKAFFTLAGAGVGSAAVGYATSKLGKDTV